VQLVSSPIDAQATDRRSFSKPSVRERKKETVEAAPRAGAIARTTFDRFLAAAGEG
jgi:hypothetical protein